MEECKTPALIYAKLSILFEVVTSTYVRRNIILFLSTLTSLSTVFKGTLVYPFFPRLLTRRTILGSASWLLYLFMPMSDKTASLLQIMESQNVTQYRLLAFLMDEKFICQYFLRFVLYRIHGNLLMKFGGISKESSNMEESQRNNQI